MVSKVLLALSVGCLVSVASANDSAVQGVGGSFQPLKGEHPQVRMVSEKVKAGIELQALAFTGGLGLTPERAAAKTLVHYRRKVRANQRRLLKG